MTALAPEEADDRTLCHYFNFDMGLERAYKALEARVEKYPGSDESFTIHNYTYDEAGDFDLDEAGRIFTQWEEDWLAAFEDIRENNGGVLIMDTETAWNDVVTIVKTNAALQNRIAKRADRDSGEKKVDHVQRLDYGERNGYMEKMLLAVAALPGATLICISRADEIFDGPKGTGKFAPRGFKYLSNVVDAQIQCIHYPAARKFIQKITFDGFDTDNNGEEFEGNDFMDLAEEMGW